jgi:hypothetical protein
MLIHLGVIDYCLLSVYFAFVLGIGLVVRTGKELATLWASPRAGELEAIRAAARAAYADRLSQGAFFVGRNRTAQPVLYDETGKPAIDLHQEAYAFDPGSGLVRRLSDTVGRVAGIDVDHGGKRLRHAGTRVVQSNRREPTRRRRP